MFYFSKREVHYKRKLCNNPDVFGVIGKTLGSRNNSQEEGQ
jgi:hypothetical protein